MKVDSGRIACADGRISYESATYGSWSLALSEVRLIGEYTNQNGPFTDDYFLVFLRHGSNDWHEASFYAAGRDACLAALGDHFPGRRFLGLSGSTDFTSRVLWPDTVGEAPLFDFRELARRDGLLKRLLGFFVPRAVIVTELRAEFRCEASASRPPNAS